MESKIVKRLLFLLIGVLLIYCSVGAKNKVMQLLPDFRGSVWISTGKVSPTVKFTIGAIIRRERDSGVKNRTHDYYSGNLECSALKGGKVIIENSNLNNGIDLVRDNGNVSCIKITVRDKESTCIISITASLVNNNFQGKVSIGIPKKTVYQTPTGKVDIFKRL